MNEYYSYYYINSDNEKEGPHDLVTMMRRIRTGIITSQTLVYRGDEDPISAHFFEELAHFFNNPTQDLRSDLQEKINVSIPKYLSIGWEFVSENPIVTVLSGLIFTISGLFGWILNETIGIVAAISGFWIMLMLIKSCYIVISLRIYRKQRTNITFFDKILSSIFLRLVLISLVFSILIPIGGLLFIVPLLFLTTIFIFSAMFLLDNNCNSLEAIHNSWKLIKKLDGKATFNIFILVFIYIFSMALIFPIPVMLPIFIGAMCSLYEDLIKI